MDEDNLTKTHTNLDYFIYWANMHKHDQELSMKGKNIQTNYETYE